MLLVEGTHQNCLSQQLAEEEEEEGGMRGRQRFRGKPGLRYAVSTQSRPKAVSFFPLSLCLSPTDCSLFLPPTLWLGKVKKEMHLR
jgi:hypothetical protein